MDAHLELIWRMAGVQTSLAVAVDQWPKAVRFAADDRDHQRQPERASANKRGRCASDTEPNRQRVLQWARVNSLSGECRTVLARPVNVRVLADVQKQIEFFGEERIVVLELQAEERKCFDERAAPGDDFGPAVGEQIERRELLEDAHGVGRA